MAEKVAIDNAKCQGHGRCALLAPSVFDVDDLGKAFLLVDEVPPEAHDEVQEAIFSCPESAIAFTG